MFLKTFQFSFFFKNNSDKFPNASMKIFDDIFDKSILNDNTGFSLSLTFKFYMFNNYNLINMLSLFII